MRLAGKDTPEIPRKKRPEQPYGYEAKNQLARLILDKEVDIKGYGLDRYNRVLGVKLHLAVCGEDAKGTKVI